MSVLRRSFQIALMILVLVFSMACPQEALAASLKLNQVAIRSCEASSQGSQKSLNEQVGIGCYEMTGEVTNSGHLSIRNGVVFAEILDQSGEIVLQNREPLGSIGEVKPGTRSFSLRISLPFGTSGSLHAKGAKAKSANSFVGEGNREKDQKLPLEQAIDPGALWGANGELLNFEN